MFAAMAEEENGHRHCLLDLYREKLGEHIPLIRRQDVKGFLERKSLWLSRPLGDAAPMKPDVQVIVSKRPDDKRPDGRRFGALVHAILAAIDLEAAAGAIQASAAVHGRMFDATQQEIQAATTAVGAALQHPILRRATAGAAVGNIRRETPVLLTLDDGSVAEGVLDLDFREQTSDFDGWSVVDFKTSRIFVRSRSIRCAS